MGAGTRQTFYFKNLDALKEVAKEENMEVNGNTFEELFWQRYVGSDETYTNKVKMLYSGDKNLKETIMDVLDVMAYTPMHMKKDNVEFIKVVREAVGAAEWFDPSDNYTDYRLNNRETRVDNIADILGVIVRELEHRSAMVKEPIFGSMKPWEIPVQDDRYSEILKNEANYDEVKIAEFKMKEERLRSSFTDDITPGEALDLIIEYWEFIWNFSHVYEAVEYCVTLTEKLNDKPMIRKKMRAFFVNQSAERAAIKLTVSHVISEGQHKAGTWQRLLAYAYGVEDMK